MLPDDRDLVTQPTRGSVDGPCPFCRRDLPLTFHHLIPRKLHRRARYQRLYSRRHLLRGIYICRDCHDAIHRTYSEIELAQRFPSPAKLLADTALQRHFQWLSRQRRSRPAL